MKTEKTGKMYHLVVPFMLAVGSTACDGSVEPGQELEAVREEPSQETAVKEGAAGDELGQVQSKLTATVNGCTGEVDRLARFYNTLGTEHFYTQSAFEASYALSNGQVYQGVPGRIFNSNFAPCGAVPLYRFLKVDAQDRLYTTNFGEVGSNPNWNYELIQGYCFPTQVTGTIPLHRLYQPSQMDHLYTTNSNEVLAAQGQGYNYEGVTCHVYPDVPDQTVQCGTQVTSSAPGSDKPYSVNVNLGVSSGTLNFVSDTRPGYASGSKDRMIVRVGGAIIHDTGCISRGGTLIPLNYSGATVANVEVLPNCDGSTTAAWSFVARCP
ncbi:hypothetical protein [Archangium sp.]|uniref:hypothetical protein n=1 Tax=Archangium sp. TaxID=1872627 RepID=UPI00286D4ABA|nr:hypothetical protein [Archangium sp.]